MTFKEHYRELLTEKKQNPDALSDASLQLIDKIMSPDKWFEAMAVCEAALDAGKIDDNILALRKEMFSRGNELHPSANLNDEDYAEWFAQIVDFNHRLADAGVGEAWVELGSLYTHSRVSYQDSSKAQEYMIRGVELNVPLAMCLHGYYLYLKTETADKEKGLELMHKAKEQNCELADTYLLLVDLDADMTTEAYMQKINDYNVAVKPEYQIWYLLGNVYRDKLDDIEKAMEAYEKGVEVNDHQCKFNKAYAILNSVVEGDKDEALRLMADSYEWNVTYAAEYLGQYYYFDEERRDVEKAIEWNKKAIWFGYPLAMLNLALIYLYDDDYKDVEKGIQYIDMSIENGNIRALCEKAYFMLETGDENLNIPAAKELLEKAFEAGDGYAAYRLGYGYQTAEFSEERDYATALKYYLIGAERNHLSCIELTGRYYCAGIIGDEPDYDKAVEYYRKAVELGSNYARVELAICYEEGYGVEQDENKAVELLKLAAAENYAFANTKLGYYYIDGIAEDSEPDYDKAFEHFMAAAESGDFDAMYYLGRMYKYAIGRPENPELALKYFRQAAEGGNIDANVEMGVAYEHEYGGLEFDGAKAMEYMAYAAEREHPYAQYKLGTYYYYGIVETDRDKGLEYLNAAYENGSSYAATVLGDHFLYGMDEKNDCNDAFQYYKFAADKNYVTEGIGICYQYGIGVERSESEAFKYFAIGADRDYSAAKYRLGLCHKYEIGTTKNLAEAFKWLSEAAEDGHRGAAYEIAMMYLDGEGVSMNLEKGVEWLRKAADDEQNDAQFELGNCYLTGRGVDEDEVQAMYWYQKAAENGNEKAQKITGRRNKKRR
jgi:TPR repeat protein